jgi:ABC-type transport system involved in multi-copper enzyme maturation permease subunit
MRAVLKRELLTALRRGAPYALLAANALLLAGLAAAVGALSATVSPWTAPSIGATTAAAPTGLWPTIVAWRGPALFFLLTSWLAVIATVAAPTIGARALTYERRAGTLDDLIGSGVGPLAILFAKLVAACLQLGLVLLSAAPAFALVWLFGGVGPRVVGLAAAFLGAYVVFLVALGLLAGALASGDLLPAALGSFAGALLLVATLVGFATLAVAGRAGAPLLAGLNPLIDLLAANRELAEALDRVLPAAFDVPLRPTVDLFGRSVGGPLPLVAGLGYALLGLALLPLAAAVLDPFHPLKTLGLRRAAVAGAER